MARWGANTVVKPSNPDTGSRVLRILELGPEGEVCARQADPRQGNPSARAQSTKGCGPVQNGQKL